LKKISESLEVPVDYLLEEKQININPHIENSTNVGIGYEVNIENQNPSIEEIFSRLDNLLNIINTKL
jgi:hypothetical protein